MLEAHLVSLIEMQQLYAPQIEASMCLTEKADLREDKGKY